VVDAARAKVTERVRAKQRGHDWRWDVTIAGALWLWDPTVSPALRGWDVRVPPALWDGMVSLSLVMTISERKLGRPMLQEAQLVEALCAGRF